VTIRDCRQAGYDRWYDAVMACKKLAISLPPEIAEGLAKESATSGVSKSKIIQMALDEYFEWLAKIEAARRANPTWGDLTDAEVAYELKGQLRKSQLQSLPSVRESTDPSVVGRR
jgi:hypothetical protein